MLLPASTYITEYGRLQPVAIASLSWHTIRAHGGKIISHRCCRRSRVILGNFIVDDVF